MDAKREANRRLWDAWTPHHLDAAMYDVDGFRDGATSLREVELAGLGALGPLAGRRVLHLQCHFGLDTLSLARLGAEVTGVDFSPVATDRARRLADECGIEARFVEADVLELDLGERFDLVYASYGVLWWLDDLERWARVVARHLGPGGALYLVEFHPLLFALDERGRPSERYVELGDAEREVVERERGSYAAPAAPVEGTSHGWHHDLGRIVSAVAGAGLRIESLREHPYSPYDCFPFLEPAGPGRWAVRGMPVGALPLLVSLVARAPASAAG